MARNIAVCCDGTNNQFGRENTSVVRLVQALERDASKQRLYYDAGVGTLPEPGLWTRSGKWISKAFGLAFGGGIFWKVEQAYAYLMEQWEPGDRVYLFGFSRGAYTARLLASMLHQIGLLPRGNQNLIPYVVRLFKALPKAGGEGIAEYLSLADQFRWSFSRPVPGDPDERRFRVHFLGLWDTVSSVGWAWDPPAYPFTTRNPSIDTIRHAISIDERRWFYRQNRVRRARADQNIKEHWFPGVHSDVGGGYPEAQGGLWRPPFTWMVTEAEAAGLFFDRSRLAAVLNASPPSAAPWLDDQHESLTPAWWPAEFFPKMQWRSNLKRRVVAIGAGRCRMLEAGALIDESTLRRLRARKDYRPGNLSTAFVQSVLALANVPSSVAYRDMQEDR